jgi:hypothetical protein
MGLGASIFVVGAFRYRAGRSSVTDLQHKLS